MRLTKLTNLFPAVATLLLLLSVQHQSQAQNRMLSSKQLMQYSLYPQSDVRSLSFTGNGSNIAYIKDTMLIVATSQGRTLQSLSLSTLRRELKESGAASTPRYIPPTTFINDNEFTFSFDGKLWKYNLKQNSISTLIDFGEIENPNVNMNTLQYAYNNGNNLCINNNGKVFTIGNNEPDVVYGQSVHRNEFGINGGIFWSPRGNLLAFYRMDQSMVTDYPMVNTSTRIAEPKPFKYPMAGMKSHEVTIGIYNTLHENIIYLKTRRDTTVDEREMYLTNVTWSPDEKYIYVAKVNRDQNHMWLERYDVATGELDKVLFEETNDRYVEPCEGLYFLPNQQNRFLWFSMRDGYKHLYLYDINGSLQKQLTSGEYEVQEIIDFDSKGENVFVYANKDNLIGRAAYMVNIKSGKMTPITSTKGTHSVAVNKNGTHVIDRYSALDTPLRVEVRNIKKAAQSIILAQPANPMAEYAMPDIKIGTIKAADGVTDLYYRLITPPNMTSDKQYPTLVYVYGGPHSQLVTDSWLGGGNLYFLFLAQQGYVVYTLDNRGTDNRGFEFESCTHRQLGTIEMADQMEGVKYLKSLPFVDTMRMGVEGWSFGGFMTITLKLNHPEVFKVGCAGGPVIDWKWYEIMYGERYMDRPQENPHGYAKASLINQADKLQGRLLVIHGAEDNTVVWQHSIEFIEACINNGRLVDYFIYPHHEHNVRGRERVHLYEKMFDYYETHLK